MRRLRHEWLREEALGVQFTELRGRSRVNSAARASYGRQSKQIRRGEDVRETGASRNFCRLVRCDSYASHAA
jgi:hypothetical protein